MKDEVADVLTTVPSILRLNEVMPTLSEAALLIEIVVFASYEVPSPGELMLTAGAVMSPTVTLFTTTETDADVLLPAASFAVTVQGCVPLATVAEFHVLVNGAVVLLLMAAPSTLKQTEATAILSVAFTVTLTAPVTDAPVLGEVILTRGAVASLLPLAETGE